MTNFTTYPIEDLYSSTLQSDLSVGGLSATVVTAITGTLSSRTCYMGIDYDKPSKYEMVQLSAISGNTVGIVTRGIATKAGTAGVARSHAAGAKVIITQSFKVFEDLATVLATKADGTPALSATVYADVTARNNALPSPTNGQQVYLTAEGKFTDRVAGAWVDRASGTNPNASTTVAGRVEIATQAELTAGTDTGGTGALLSAVPSNLAVMNQNNPHTFAVTGGSSTVYTLTLAPAIAAYATGQRFSFQAHATNGASATINVNGRGAVALVDSLNVAMVAGSILLNQCYQITYNGTSFNVVAATLPVTTTKGDVSTFSTVPARLAVGVNDQSLIADSAQTTGLKWAYQSKKLTTVSGQTTVANTAAKTMLATVSVPANSLGTNNQIVYRATLAPLTAAGANQLDIILDYGATLVATCQIPNPAATTMTGYVEVTLTAGGLTNSQTAVIALVAMEVGTQADIAGTSAFQTGTAAEDSTAAKTFTVSAQWSGASASDTVTFSNQSITLIA